MSESLAAMRRSFDETPLHQLLGLRFVSYDGGEVVMEMPVQPAAFNSSGNLHGGAIATLIDVCAGTAAALGSSFQPGVTSIVTADLHVRYLGRPRTDTVRAYASVLRAGRALVVVECRVRDGEDRVIAAADFSAMVVPLREPLRPNTSAVRTDPDL